MESLYTKYRPQTFDQVVGQTHVVDTLKRAVLEGRTSHAYLFCGPRGTGKTTMARIVAKALMCEQGPQALPDGTCEQCRLIAAGEHPDVIELDAASRTGVDNVREEIISRVKYAPTRGRCKVYIIDEVHMLTIAAFNALLKTLEEPPEHVIFIMCTTDPQKILPTILSRVQRFDFHSIGAEEMQKHLAFICDQEGFTYDEAALELIVRHARGGMRDALTSLEQLSVFGEGKVSLKAATDFLGEVSQSVLQQASNALAQRDVAALFQAVSKLVESGHDLLQFTRELAAHVRDVYVVSVAPNDSEVVDAREEKLKALRAEAKAFGSTDRIARVLSILGDASREMRTATNQRLVLEIAYTRAARPESDLTLEALAERITTLEQQVNELLVTDAPVREVISTPVSDNVEQQSTPQQVSTLSSRKKKTPANAQTLPSKPVTSKGELQRRWKQTIETLVKDMPAKGSLLLSSMAVFDDGEKLTISLPQGSHFAVHMLEREDVREAINPTIASIFGARQLVYVESSLAQQRIASVEKSAAPSRLSRSQAAQQQVPRTTSQIQDTPVAAVPPVASAVIPAQTQEPMSAPKSVAEPEPLAASATPDATPVPEPPAVSVTPEPASDLSDLTSMLSEAFGPSVSVRVAKSEKEAIKDPSVSKNVSKDEE